MVCSMGSVSAVSVFAEEETAEAAGDEDVVYVDPLEAEDGLPFAATELSKGKTIGVSVQTHANAFFLAEIDGVKATLEKGGIDLSKGQWQRLAVSRLFLTDTTYTILDEPTASMDPVSEYKMYQLFYSLMKSRGSLMISHRLISAKMADHILVLKHGNIIEQGNHDDLMKSQGEYLSLIHI